MNQNKKNPEAQFAYGVAATVVVVSVALLIKQKINFAALDAGAMRVQSYAESLGGTFEGYQEFVKNLK